MALLIDSSVFINLERRGASLSTLTDALYEPIGLSTVAATELLTGVWRANTEARRSRRLQFVEAVIGAVPIIPFDLRSARTHAQLWAALDAAGRPIGEHDLLIAATALAYGYDVLTDNVREYGNVPSLVVRRPTWST